jgi:hypothetical protein
MPIYGLCITLTRLESSYERGEFIDKLLEVEYLSPYLLSNSVSAVEVELMSVTQWLTLKFRLNASMIDQFGDQSVRR